MAEDRNIDRKLLYYICGWCKDKITYSKGEEKPNPCPNCGWCHTDKLQYDGVPSDIKLDLTNL